MVSDEALVERVRAGEARAFDELYARYETRLFGFCLRILKNRADAEEVFHEAFIRALKADDAEFEGGSFKGFLYQIARNLCLNRRRSDVRAQKLVESLPAAEPPVSADDALEALQRFAALDRAVEALPPALHEVYELRASGLSYDEIAGVLSIPLGTLKSRMNQLVKQLREDIESWTVR